MNRIPGKCSVHRVRNNRGCGSMPLRDLIQLEVVDRNKLQRFGDKWDGRACWCRKS